MTAPNLALVIASICRTAAPHDHRHAHRLGLVDAEPNVLVGKAGGEAEIKGAGQDGAGEFVLAWRCCGRCWR